MIEAGVVIGEGDRVAVWHLPPNRSAGSIPDTESLWNLLWKHRKTASGFAHSHPGGGVPAPSWEDVTTFAAVELGLGRRLKWPIVSADYMAVYEWGGPGEHDYWPTIVPREEEPPWANKLRMTSEMGPSRWELHEGDENGKSGIGG